MYSIKFENLYFEKVWGGRDLELFRDNLPDGNIGESWDVACHKNGMSVVANGEFKGKRLDELIKEKGEELLGTKVDKTAFPLLIKLINSKESLSVQVHPNDSYAKRVEGESGKTEVWYVVEAFEGANLVVGTKEGCRKEQFKKAIEEGKLENYMNRISVKKGDVYFVESGLIHSIGEGVIIAEIQQNSDTTYRVYDYNRGRKLHIQKALDVVNLELKGERNVGKKIGYNGYNKIKYCTCEKFILEMYDIYDKVKESSDKERFYIFTCVDGEGKIVSSGVSEAIKKGDSFLIPAALGEYEIKGKLKVLKSYVPNL
ncbi:class I mannose-6-phosphate isomerase [Clostridiaceae bacterium UIB06]|uniref:Phosphohexomutase n=1 Tax=Clostridium thailandense TaxID=2794346 RepID=A0A949TGT4_9CLOT|nr:type I phosphomannose isomerase catalytic subunit [Clostridium thailandense]MBV7272529.1 class I mannose-6-phosphate isomerase [Clostridium thailandense]MCH5138069.1 class I mannose-6-phosphate isomerase [Clostridiaceae bacterium UIB06]